MTALAAQESGLDREFISDLNKNAPQMLYHLYLSTKVVRLAVMAQHKIIEKIAGNGSCVIVGRAAYYHSISGCRWGDRRQYDLMVDSSIGEEETAGVIRKYLDGRAGKQARAD